MITATLDLSGLHKKLAKLTGDVDLVMRDELRRNARLLVSSSGKVPGIVQVTPPHSQGVRGSAAKKQGENAVASDILTVYASPSRVYGLIRSYADERTAKRYWWLLKNEPEKAALWLDRDAPDAIRALARGWDAGDMHRKRRTRRGRVAGSKPSVLLMTKAEERQLERYIKMRKSHVGLLAASALAAANSSLGELKGVPAWVDRHRPAWGDVRELNVATSRLIEIRVAAPYVFYEMQRRFRYVLEYRAAAMQRETPYRLRAALKKLSNRQAA